MFKKKGFFDSGSSGSNTNNAEGVDVAELKSQIAKLEEQVRIQKEIKTTLLEEHTKEIELLTSENKKLNDRVSSLTAENESLRSNFEKLKGIFDSSSDEKIVLFFGSETASDAVIQTERSTFAKFMAYERQRIDEIVRSLKNMKLEGVKSVCEGEPAPAAAWKGFKSLNDSISRLSEACEKIKTVPDIEKVLDDIPPPLPPPPASSSEGNGEGEKTESDPTLDINKKLGDINNLVTKQNELLSKLKSKS